MDPTTGQLLDAWQKAAYTPEQIAAMNGVVRCVGTRTGPDANHCVFIDIDGQTAIEACRERGCSTAEIGWAVRRNTSSDRLKVVIHIPPDLRHHLAREDGTPVGKCVLTTKPTVYQLNEDGTPVRGDDGRLITLEPAEQIELFYGSGQCIVLGEHLESGGYYTWSGEPAQVKEPSPAWWGLILDLLERSQSEARAARSTIRRSAPTGSVIQSGPRTPCPTCGRNTSGACTLYTEGGRLRINCFEGQTFSPPLAQKKGETVPGADGRLWGFCRHGFNPAIGGFSVFIEHVEHPRPERLNEKRVPEGSRNVDALQLAAVADIAATVIETDQASSLTLDPIALIGGGLGQAIADRSDRLRIPAAVLINGLLPVAASQLPIGIRVCLNEDSDFSQPPILWSLSVAPTGSNKSETSDVSVKPLYRFQDDTPSDQERHYFTNSFTLPGLARIQSAQPSRGCLINPDEMSGFVRKLQSEQQRGTTDELSRLLSIYDGRPLRGTFSDKSLNYNLKGSAFSLLSTIQPSVLLECMGDLDDASGLWARFNLCEIPPQRRRMTRSGRSSDGLMTSLQAAYLCLQSRQPFTFALSSEAADLFDSFYDSCEDQRLDQTLEPALRAYAAKQEGRCGRVALVLHNLQAAATKTQPPPFITPETMLGAIAICDFYQQQLRRFYTLALAHLSESLEGASLLVFEFIKNASSPSSIRQINKGPRALRKLTTDQITQALELLSAKNLIRSTPDGWIKTSI